MAKALTENYPFHDSEEDEPPSEVTHKLVDGVTLRDFYSKEGGIFEIDEEYDADQDYADKIYEIEHKEIAHVHSSKLREDRVAPRPEQSFESIEAEMEPVDDDRYVMKKVITPGVGTPMPEHASVVIDYKFYKEHDPIPFDSTFLQGRKKRFILDHDVILGLNMAVKTMKKRETSKFLIKWQVAFGEKGIPPRVDPKMNILAIITLIDFQEIIGNLDPNALTEEEVNKVTFEDVIKKVRSYRDEGNKSYRSDNYSRAVSFYNRGIGELNKLHLANSEEERAMLELKDIILINLANCYNNIKRPESACLACQEVLSRHNNHGKAFFQLGKAKYLLGNYNDCRKYLLKAKTLAPKDPAINILLKKCNDREAIIRAEQKELYQRMFGQHSEQNKENQYKPERDNESIFLGFEKTLREVLKSHFEDSVDDFIYSAKLTPVEIETSLKVAQDMKLNYEESEDGIHFKLRSNK